MIADDEPNTEISFELLDRGGQRRLRDVAGFRRTREMLLACERNEVRKMTN